ncbi:lytic transglycosylase domain-containing protein [Paenibacillus herberti]|uniref:Lytic transglycosylase n=1 Tax=Paenibacillus herberti TaxID=1619309 RepID=A0A229P121_9BACL|nr:lytic transglycosylase domain-containing protein [Paenibacillus herberti]OXM15634.1 lytic transglycosylase [Paenibacillus herberti]
MSIDPRTLTALIKLQLAPSLEMFTGTSSNTASATNNGFDQILSQLTSATSSSSLDTSGLQALETGYTDVDVSGYGGGLAGNSGTLGMNSAGLQAALVAAGSSLADVGVGTANGSGNGAFDQLINGAAAKYDISPSLIRSVIDAESSFNPQAVSSAGAKGLMQLMDGTASGLGVTNSFDPAQNIDGGTKYLSYLLGKFENSVPAALAAYNAGPGRLDRLGIKDEASLNEKYDSLPQETQNYVLKVMRKLEGAGL